MPEDPHAWWRHGVVYQVYPRSFQDSNGDGVGDLRGIISRLDHLNDGTERSLGVDAIWLSPFYPSPMADFGYDVADYCDVDPAFGTLADFDRLVEEGRRRGIRVIVDLVPNHTSDEHPWFVDARSSRTSRHRDWYVWADPAPGGGPPNGWRSTFATMGPAWTLDERTGQYYLHSFHRRQPDLNWWNPEVRAAFEEIIRFWLDRGVGGIRIDVAHKTVKARDLAAPTGENPRGTPDLTPPADEAEMHALLRSWRRLLDEYGDRMAVGEVFLLDPDLMVRYYGEAADELHLAFNFAFLRQPWSAEAFRAATDTFESLLPPGAWPDYTLSNHDNPRARSRYDEGGGTGEARARLAAMMLLGLRGTPFIYYGEEIGQPDGVVQAERIVDVDGRDPERTPMQWEGGPGAGFTTGEPWLPIGPSAATVSVAAQRDDPGSILSLYRRLIRFRKRSPALAAGSYRAIEAGRDVFAWLREADDERLLVALNFADRPMTLDLGAVAADGRVEVSTDPDRDPDRVHLGRLRLGPTEGIVVRPG